MNPEAFLEPFVDAARAADFLAVKPRWLLELARAGKIPAHPLGNGKSRRLWRFRLSEIVHAISGKVVASGSTPSYGSTDKAATRGKSESK